MKTIEEIIKEEIGIEPDANEFTPMDYGECKRCMQKYADQESNRLEKLGYSEGAPQPVQTAGSVVYAVKGKGKYFLLHISKNENELDEKIQNAYWMARGLQPSGNNYKVEDFMKDMEKVKVTIEKL